MKKNHLLFTMYMTGALLCCFVSHDYQLAVIPLLVFVALMYFEFLKMAFVRDNTMDKMKAFEAMKKGFSIRHVAWTSGSYIYWSVITERVVDGNGESFDFVGCKLKDGWIKFKLL